LIDAFFNFATLFILLISPIVIYKFRNEKSFWVLYLITGIQMIIMILTSPQYRYFIHFILIFLLLFLSILLKNKRFILILFLLSNIFIAAVLIFPFHFKSSSNNVFISKNSTIELKNICFPEPNSNNLTKFNKIKKGNLTYNTPIENSFFWGCGDGDLPTINRKQLDYFERYYQILPQLRTNKLKDGFYAKKTNPF
jgi:hypothetical protein